MRIQLMWAVLSLSFEPPASTTLLVTPGVLWLRYEIRVVKTHER